MIVADSHTHNSPRAALPAGESCESRGGSRLRIGWIMSRPEVPRCSIQTDSRGQARSGNREMRAKQRDVEQPQVQWDRNQDRRLSANSGQAGRSGTGRIGNR